MIGIVCNIIEVIKEGVLEIKWWRCIVGYDLNKDSVIRRVVERVSWVEVYLNRAVSICVACPIANVDEHVAQSWETNVDPSIVLPSVARRHFPIANRPFFQLRTSCHRGRNIESGSEWGQLSSTNIRFKGTRSETHWGSFGRRGALGLGAAAEGWVDLRITAVGHARYIVVEAHVVGGGGETRVASVGCLDLSESKRGWSNYQKQQQGRCLHY